MYSDTLSIISPLRYSSHFSSSLKRFSAAVSQALEFGSPLAEVLEQQAQAIRDEQRSEMEAEIVELDKEEKEMFLSDLGLEQSGLDRLINECYTLLGLISFLTAGKPEVRAWTIKKGTKAPQAAGKIHTDFERGFIRAEVIAFDDLIACGSMTAAKEKGLVRSEGKEYVMKDGDVVLFRFNV